MGGTDWYPNPLPSIYSRRNPARTALLTANWDPPEGLKDLLAPLRCGYHYSQALDIFRASPDVGTEVVSAAAKPAAVQFYRVFLGTPLVTCRPTAISLMALRCLV